MGQKLCGGLAVLFLCEGNGWRSGRVTVVKRVVRRLFCTNKIRDTNIY